MNAVQEDFDLMIGRLDHILSMMVGWGKRIKSNPCSLSDNNTQTLKHHAEDMILAGRKILKDLECEEPK